MKKIYLYITLLFISAVVIISTIIYNNYEKNKNIFLNSYTKHNEIITNLNMKNLNTVSKVIFDTNINIPYVQKLMYEASNTKDPQKLTELREKLYDFFKKKFQYYKMLGFREFFFFFPNVTAFLRIHKPSKYEDSLIGIRKTFEYVAKYKKPVTAYEEGRFFNGFRNVYPIFYNNKFVGGVELSYSFLALERELYNSCNLSYVFITSEKIAKAKQSKSIYYKKSEFKDFVYDKATIVHDLPIAFNKISKINALIANQVNNKLQKGEKFSVTFQNNTIIPHKLIVITFIPVFNLDKKAAAYIIYYKEAKLMQIMKNNTIKFALFALASLIFIMIIILLILKHQEKKEIDEINSYK